MLIKKVLIIAAIQIPLSENLISHFKLLEISKISFLVLILYFFALILRLFNFVVKVNFIIACKLVLSDIFRRQLTFFLLSRFEYLNRKKIIVRTD